MRRHVLVVFLLVLSGSFLFGEDSGIIDGLMNIDTGDDIIQRKVMLFDSLKYDPSKAILLNGVIGFGSGSFAQNDMISGYFGFSMDVVGIGLTVGGIYSTNTEGIDDKTGAIVIGIGISTYIVSKLFQLTRPVKYSSKHNRDLWNALMKE